MKTLLIKSLITLSLLMTFSFAKYNYKYYNRVNFDQFYYSLNSYGEWIEIDYDVVVWKPYNVSRNWRPYTLGSWHWTTDGWYWDSYEPFGWATYHYGRWHFDDYYGWIWFPDYDWAPSWVEWRYSNDYIGWAPLSPYARYKPGFGISFSINWRTPYQHWHFVKSNHFYHRNVNVYIVNINYNKNIYRTTKYRNDYYERDGRIFNNGPDRSFVERRSGTRINETRTISVNDRESFERTRNSNDSEIRIYRPSSDESRNVSRTEISIKRGERTTSIDKENIVGTRTRNESDNSNVNTRTRNIESESKNATNRSRDTEIIREREKRIENNEIERNRNNTIERKTETNSNERKTNIERKRENSGNNENSTIKRERSTDNNTRIESSSRTRNTESSNSSKNNESRTNERRREPQVDNNSTRNETSRTQVRTR